MRRVRRLCTILLALTLGMAVAGLSATQAGAAQAPVGLGTASSFAVLAGATITNTGPSVITGGVGLSPGSAITGFPPGKVNGTIHAADAAAAQAQADVTTAYNDAAGRSPSATVSADLGGQRLLPGVYTGGTLGLTGTLTLDAKGDPQAVFIFQSASTLITASSSNVVMVNGGNACRVFWQVTSSATLGTNSVFIGTVLALTSITANTGAVIFGRLLARNGAVTLDSNKMNRPSCTTGTSTTKSTTATTKGATANLPRTGPRGVTATSLYALLAVIAGGMMLVTARRRRIR
ncbi:MAG: ice-binding family protein [Ilumatobacteraceae bacterium]